MLLSKETNQTGSHLALYIEIAKTEKNIRDLFYLAT